MTSDEIFAAIEHVAAAPGKNDKIALVTKYAQDDQFKRVLAATYNPLVTYGVRKFLPFHISGSGHFNDGTWFLLDILAKRESSGTAALEAIRDEMQRLTADSATLLKRIMLGDMRAGFEAETCNKAVKGLVPVFPYMRCSLPKHIKDMAAFFKDGAIAQEKADGLYLNVDHEVGGIVRLTTRQGTQYPMEAFEEFAAAVRATLTAGTQTQGEMVVLRDGKILPRQDGNGVLNHVAAGGDFAENEKPLFLVWDQIPLSAVVPKGKYMVPYKERLASVVHQLQLTRASHGHLALIETEVVRSLEQAWAFYKKKLAQGKEGAVIKKMNAIWKDGTSLEQIKLKLKAPFEARVTGFNEGNGKNAGKISSLQCASECKQLEFSVSCRGDAMIDAVTKAPHDWMDAVVTVEGNSIMEPSDSNPKHSIFLPIFVERRTDKSNADTLERIREQFQAAMEAA